MKLDAIYEVTPHAAEQAASLRLTAVEWLLYQALLGQAPCLARDLAKQLQFDPETASTILGKLQQAELIHEPLLSLPEYRARFDPAADSEDASTDDSESTGPTVTFTMKKRANFGERAANGTNGTNGTNGDMRQSGGESFNAGQSPDGDMQSLFELVRRRGGGGALGQLAIYQMFLQVPQDLLEAARLQHVDLEKPDLRIEDPRLVEALRTSASQVLGIPRQALDKLVA